MVSCESVTSLNLHVSVWTRSTLSNCFRAFWYRLDSLGTSLAMLDSPSAEYSVSSILIVVSDPDEAEALGQLRHVETLSTMRCSWEETFTRSPADRTR